jgi:ribosomal protein L7/L12
MKYNFILGASQSVSLDKCLVVAVLAMRKCGNNVESIKLLRHAGKIDGLKEAKDLSEFIADQFAFSTDGTMAVKRTLPMVRWTGTSED